MFGCIVQILFDFHLLAQKPKKYFYNKIHDTEQVIEQPGTVYNMVNFVVLRNIVDDGT